MGAWGGWAMVQGNRLFVMGMTRALAPASFYALCSLVTVMNLGAAWAARRHAQG